MLAWILILVSWAAVLSLILHDATKDDDGGGAISIAVKRSREFVAAWLKSHRAPKAPGHSKTALPTSPANSGATVGAVAASAEPTQQAATETVKQTVLAKKWRSKKDGRVSITIPNLEFVIAEAVKKSPDCEAFVGVVVRHRRAKSSNDVDWEIRGIKFGNADRDKADAALLPIVERMQREFSIKKD